MPRKRLARKPAKKHQTKAQSTYTVSQNELMEQTFWKVPAALVAQLGNDIRLLKQHEKQVKAGVLKFKTQLQKDTARVKSTAKIKTAAGKKQLTAAKKSLDITTVTLKKLTVKLYDLQKHLALLTDKQLKLAAVSKILSQFNKNWKSKPKKKVATKVKAKKKVSKPSESKPQFTSSTTSAPVTEIESIDQPLNQEEVV